MSGGTLANSQTTTNSTFDDGAFVEALRAGLRPDPHLSVAGWADKHRVLDTRSASEAGQWRTARTPYLREIMEALSTDSPAQKIVMIAGAQIGKTETGLNWVGYTIDHAPGPMLAVQPTLNMAARFSKQRLDPLLSASPRLAALIPPSRSRDSGNTTYSKEFAGGILVLTGANSASGLRSMPARNLFLDEVDAYPGDLEGEGDPVALAELRTRTFGRRRKIFMTSTPTIAGMSRIEREYEMTDKRRYNVPCPSCGGLQWLKFERLVWTKGRPETVAYACEHCEEPIEEHQKTWFMAEENGAQWEATAEGVPHTRGYHISSLYSPLGWLSWEQIAREWEAAQGSDDAIKAFKNGVLGETWQETGEAPEWKRLYDVREERPLSVVPARAVFLTAGVDVQKDRLECSVYAWARGMESWLVTHEVFYGSPGDPEPWNELETILEDGFEIDGGGRMAVKRMAVDTGYETQVVYSWARRMASPTIMPVKGEEKFDKAQPVSGPTFVDITEGGRKIRRGARLWRVAVSTFKSETYRFLRKDRPTDEDLEADGFPPGYVHFPTGVDEEFFKQLTAENLVTRQDRRGFSRYEWVKIRDRNETLDCRVYARAAAYALGADFWPSHRWDRAEQAAENMEGRTDVPPHPKPAASGPEDGPRRATGKGRKKGAVRPRW